MIYKIVCIVGGIGCWLCAVFLSCLAFGMEFSYQTIGMVFMVTSIYNGIIQLLEKVNKD